MTCNGYDFFFLEWLKWADDFFHLQHLYKISETSTLMKTNKHNGQICSNAFEDVCSVAQHGLFISTPPSLLVGSNPLMARTTNMLMPVLLADCWVQGHGLSADWHCAEGLAPVVAPSVCCLSTAVPGGLCTLSRMDSIHALSHYSTGLFVVQVAVPLGLGLQCEMHSSHSFGMLTMMCLWK